MKIQLRRRGRRVRDTEKVKERMDKRREREI